MKQLMNDSQVEKHDMVCALLTFFGLNPTIVATVQDLADIIPLLTADKDEISAVAEDRDEKKTAFKDVKPGSRAELAIYAFTYSRKLRALGKKSNIAELLNFSCPSKSEMEKMRFKNFSEYCAEVLFFLNKYLLQLSGQEVIQADVDEFETMIEAYKSTLSNMDVTRDETIEETGDLEEKFTEMMAKVYQIDDIIDGMRKKHKEFCDTYDVTRQIHQYGLRHRTAEEIELLRAKNRARQAKFQAAKRERAQKAKAEKIQKLRDKVSQEIGILPEDPGTGNNN